MKKKDSIKEIKRKDEDTDELMGPCLHVHDIRIDDTRREKRKLYRCYSPLTKSEYYLVETNSIHRKEFSIDKFAETIDFFFSDSSTIQF
jgi:hypothetical protein